MIASHHDVLDITLTSTHKHTLLSKHAPTSTETSGFKAFSPELWNSSLIKDRRDHNRASKQLTLHIIIIDLLLLINDSPQHKVVSDSLSLPKRQALKS